MMGTRSYYEDPGDDVLARLEGADELLALGAGVPPHPATVLEATAPSDARPFRPVYRPPMGLLVVVDDGKDDGERLRLRGDAFTIGRAEGDLVVPHDRMMSGKHARLTREVQSGRYRWFVNDLQSSNGTFVRAKATELKHGQEFMLGGTRFRFHAALQGMPGADLPPAAAGAVRTQDWHSVKAADLIPSIQELGPEGTEGARHLLNADQVVVGRGAGCGVTVDDPMMSPQHARLAKDARGRWTLENLQSLNGTWVRLSRTGVDRYGQFILGEQRFILFVL